MPKKNQTQLEHQMLIEKIDQRIHEEDFVGERNTKRYTQATA